MPQKHTAPPGNWKSNINAALVANGSPRLGDLCLSGDACYWTESIASEKGRMSIMRQCDGKTESILPSPFNVRSQVHEYGGGALCVTAEYIFFVNGEDQDIYYLDKNDPSNATPTSLTKAPRCRFADLSWNEHGQSLLAIAEIHEETNGENEHSEPENTVVEIQLDGTITTLASDHDFYANPRASQSGNYLCWVSWDHPNMPWNATQLHIVPTSKDTEVITLGLAQKQSLLQPVWAEDDSLFFVSDINDWWNIYSVKPEDQFSKPKAIYEKPAEFATPQWTFAMQHYAIVSKNEIAAAYTENGFWKLDIINLETQDKTTVVSETAWIDQVCFENGVLGFIESHTDKQPSPSLIKLDSKDWLLRSKSETDTQAEISKPESIYFQTKSVLKGHAFYYPAHNSQYRSTEPSPLIVLCHGGPTGQTSAGLSFKTQYWTNRGFAVVDVNYRGSTGFGKPYRDTLNNSWGICDVEDMVSVVDHLIAEGKVDPEKTIIKGGSAGGYTVLAALTFTDRFKVGVSLYGIGDLELLARDTHKFEKHYLDTLVGAYPQQKNIYVERSPIHHTNRLNCAMLLFQGLKDKVVPPNQAQTMKKAVEEKGLPVELVEFADEGHGFRNPANIETMLEAELEFYQRVL